MKLYYSPGACSLSPHIALIESGLNFDIEKVDLKAGKTETGADYASINPKGYVPALKLDNGSLLTEGPTIVQYIADHSTSAKIAPPHGAMSRYELTEWLGYINSEIHKTFSPLFDKSSPDETKAAARKKLDRRFAYAAKQLANHDYLIDNTFSVADGYLFVTLRWAKAMAVDLSAYPSLEAYRERMNQRPAVLAALKQEGIEAI
jgi:glutathione S-transferase